MTDSEVRLRRIATLPLAKAAPEWRISGDEPPPAELPPGMAWSKSIHLGEWDVRLAGRVVGFISCRHAEGKYTTSVKGSYTAHPTALEAARALAAALRGDA